MPEHNLIQAPELLRRLSRMLGIRQAHVSPTLDDTAKAVIVLGDAREQTVRPWSVSLTFTSLGNNAGQLLAIMNTGGYSLGGIVQRGPRVQRVKSIGISVSGGSGHYVTETRVGVPPTGLGITLGNLLGTSVSDENAFYQDTRESVETAYALWWDQAGAITGASSTGVQVNPIVDRNEGAHDQSGPIMIYENLELTPGQMLWVRAVPPDGWNTLGQKIAFLVVGESVVD